MSLSICFAWSCWSWWASPTPEIPHGTANATGSHSPHRGCPVGPWLWWLGDQHSGAHETERVSQSLSSALFCISLFPGRLCLEDGKVNSTISRFASHQLSNPSGVTPASLKVPLEALELNVIGLPRSPVLPRPPALPRANHVAGAGVTGHAWILLLFSEQEIESACTEPHGPTVEKWGSPKW